MQIKNNHEPHEPVKPKKKKRWLWLKIMLISIVVLVAGGMIFNNQIMGYWVKTQTTPANYLKVPKEEMKKNVEVANKEGNFDGDTAVPVSAENLVKAALENKDKPITGGISMPQLGINLPIMADDGDYAMLYGAGPLQPGQVMGEGNYTLASHDMWTNASYYSKTLLFSPLVNAAAGQDIYLTDKDKVYHYVVYDVQRVTPDEWDLAVDEVPGKNVVTLITCDTNDEYRIMVRGDLVDVKPFNDETAVPFTGEQNQYKG